jgi:hypothetical protein
MTLNNLGLALRYVRRFDEAITAHQDAATMTVTCVRQVFTFGRELGFCVSARSSPTG